MAIGFDKHGIGRVLADGKLAVPAYQRSYSWERQNITDFLDDIERAFHDGETEYFLGSIVVANNELGRPDVVDGQQRLATTMILIAAIRDHFSAARDTRAQDIDGQFLMNRDLRTQQDVQKFELNERDNPFFLNSILRPMSPLPAPERESHSAIQLAYDIISDRIKQKIAESGSANFWIEVVLYLQDKAKVIVLTVPSNENAFVLFETLNDRGLDLAISDLLKNYLFRTAGNRLPEVRENWVAMQRHFEMSGNEALIVDYIRQFYSSKNGLTREKDLFGEIKRTVAERQSIVEFSAELVRNARFYQAIVNSDHAFWKEISPKARKHIGILECLNLTRIRPLLLSILDQLPATEVDVCLRRTVSWAVRLLVLAALGTGKTEAAFCRRAKEIRDGVIKTANDLSVAMESTIPTDEAFAEAFSNVVVSKSKVSRYLLSVLEREASGDKQPELVVNEESSELNLEHVLPQTPGTDWANFSAAEVAAYCHRLGNQVLLRASENSSLGNGSFSKKKPILAQSTLSLTKEVASERSWGPKEIKKRQEKMSLLAVSAWPLE